MKNKIKNELVMLNHKKDRLEKQSQEVMKEILELAQRQSVYDITTFMDSKLNRLKEIRQEQSFLEENINMVKYFLMEEK